MSDIEIGGMLTQSLLLTLAPCRINSSATSLLLSLADT